MADILKPFELVNIGIRIEENGIDFYKNLSVKAKNEKVKEIFVFLMHQEENHKKKFLEIVSKLEKHDIKESYDNEYSGYAQSLIESMMFNIEKTGINISNGVDNDKDAIDLAIGLEKDSILFYETMKSFVASELSGIAVELIKQEQAHLKLLVESRKLI